ncbi:MAG: chloride channel protein [Oscillospiraceae bacterium]
MNKISLEMLKKKISDFLLQIKNKPIKEWPVWSFLRWSIIAFIVGLTVGPVGILFHYALDIATNTRMQFDWLIFFLPIVGIAIAWMYKRFANEDKGTNMVLCAIRSDKEMKPITAPLIFISTVLTHLFGGSAGREGAALQLGGSIATTVGTLFHLDEKDKHVLVMCGTSAAFAALFGTPVTAAIFSLEVISIGLMYYSAIIPCVISAITGASLAILAKISPTAYTLVGIESTSIVPILQALLLGVLCAVVSIFFCNMMRGVSKLFKKILPNVYLRAMVGGLLIIGLTLLVGTRSYNGVGSAVIAKAIEGTALPYDFLLKIVFTAITLGSGFKGGEIVPVFFTGATFGCVAGGLIGLNPSFGAGIGMVALFCGVTNCPITSIILSIEMFGTKGLPLFAVAIAASYMLSGYSGLYGEQKIVYSKLKAEFIDIKAK